MPQYLDNAIYHLKQARAHLLDAEKRLDQLAGASARQQKVIVHVHSRLIRGKGRVRGLSPQAKKAYLVWRDMSSTRTRRAGGVTRARLEREVARRHPDIKSPQAVVSMLVHRFTVLKVRT